MSKFTLLALGLFLGAYSADDWPAYRKDGARSGITKERPAFPLSKAWRYEPAQAPAPAWPEPVVEMHRVDFDYAFQPVVAGGLVYFGSSADDSVRALDLMTGKERWRFTTGGPVRFAPHISNGRCFFASDDGIVYCVDARNGALTWKFRAAFNSRQLSGTG